MKLTFLIKISFIAACRYLDREYIIANFLHANFKVEMLNINGNSLVKIIFHLATLEKRNDFS